MTLSEIENVLADLSKRHPHLDKELLTTLLLAAGWEGKTITDAVLLFESKKNEVVPNTEEITFYKPDGKEEGTLPVFLPEDQVKPEEEKPLLSVKTPSTPTEQGSLIVEKEIVPALSLEHHIPDNLPLVPFESAPHVWSFSKYKDTFHGEVMGENPLPSQSDQVVPIVTPPLIPKIEPIMEPAPLPPPQPIKVPEVPYIEEEIVAEKMPMNRSDESLVFLAGVMLLGIILILGYMYSNGRL